MFATAGGTVRALQATGSGLLAGGDFASTGGQRQDNLAAFHADTGLPADWRVTTDGRVNGIEPAGRRLYVYGPFSRIGGVRRRGFAALDRRTGRVLPRFRPPRPGGFVSGFAVRGSRIYIAGEFNRLGRVRRANSLFALDARTGRVIRSFGVRTRNATRGESAPGSIRGLAVEGRRLYIGGAFQDRGQAPSQSRRREPTDRSPRARLSTPPASRAQRAALRRDALRTRSAAVPPR